MIDFKLYKFQDKDINELIRKERFINANYMGLGKTVESIVLADRVEAKKILIVCRSDLISQWAKEIQKFSINPKGLKISGNRKTREHLLKTGINSNDIRWIIINKEMLQVKKVKKLNRNGVEVIKTVNQYSIIEDTLWDIIYVDEFHDFRSRGTLMSKGLSKLKTKYFFGLTGTPMPKSPEDIWNLLYLINPDEFSSYWNFVDTYFITRTGFFSKKEIVGVKDKNVFEEMLKRYMIRNLRNETDLPEKIEKNILLDLTEEAKLLYKDIKKDMQYTMKNLSESDPDYLKRIGTALEQSLKLQFLCLTPKILDDNCEYGTKIDEVIRICKEVDGQIVLVSKYKKFLYLLQKALDENKITNIIYNGDFNKEQREKKLTEFQKSNKIKILIGTIQTIGTGLNLQNAQTLIFADKSFIPEENNQVISRIYRTGQVNKTLIISLICANTIEEYIEDVLSNRIDAINEALMLKNYINLEREELL